MPTSIGLLRRPARCRTAVRRGNLKSQASCTSAPAHAALSRQRALRVAPLVVISLLGAVDSSLAKKSPPPPPPKTEYELMMENLQKEGKAPTDEAVNKVFDRGAVACPLNLADHPSPTGCSIRAIEIACFTARGSLSAN
jgi:hypothetical protein